MDFTQQLKFTIARAISDKELSASEKQAYYLWEMTPMEFIVENWVVWLN